MNVYCVEWWNVAIGKYEQEYYADVRCAAERLHWLQETHHPDTSPTLETLRVDTSSHIDSLDKSAGRF